jgi:PKHD-type hydroxylase
MLIAINGVLTKEEVATLRQIATTGEFVDGRSTAGFRAQRVKSNLQLKKTPEQAKIVNTTVVEALRRSVAFRVSVFPKRIDAPLFSRYVPGMRYGAHVDDPLMNKDSPFRTDVAVTIFLSDPAEYDGGELVVETAFGRQAVKLPAGDAVAYPASSVHRVAEVTRGERLAAVTWAQSMVREPARRELLHDLDAVRRLLAGKHADAPETDLAFKAYANLLRMWAEP